MLQKLRSSQQKYRYRASSSQSPSTNKPARRLYSRQRVSSFVKPKIRSNSYLKIFQASEPLVKRKLTEMNDPKDAFEYLKMPSRDEHCRVLATQIESKQADSVFDIDISKLSTKHIMAEKKKRLQNTFSRVLKSNPSQQTGIEGSKSQEISEQGKKQNMTANILFKYKKKVIQKFKQEEQEAMDVEEMHYYMVKHNQKIKRLTVN